MTTFQFFATKRQHIAIVNGEKFTTNCDYSNKEFTPLTEPVFIPANLFSIESETIQQAYYFFVGHLINSKEEKKNKNAQMQIWADQVKATPDNYTPLEIYKAACIINKRPLAGWQGADLLLAKTPFSKAIKVSYTVSPFDDGGLMIKVGNKKYGNMRGCGDVEDLLK